MTTPPPLPPLDRAASDLFRPEYQHLLARCGSTNDEGRRLLLEGAPEGSLVLADAQDAGRGRLGRSWHSPPGASIYLSLVLRPELAPDQIPLVTLVLALAARAAVCAAGVPAAIKWPNDLIVRDHHYKGARKLSGIVCEAVTHAGRLGVVAGIGVNVNLAISAFPLELRQTATSMAVESGHEHSREGVVAGILQQFAPRYRALVADGAAAILPEYRRCLDTAGRQVTVDTGELTIRGKAVGIGARGELLVQTRGGETVEINAGDVGL